MTVQRECLKQWATKLQGTDHKHKTICNSSVTDFFGATDGVHFLHTVDDVVRAIRKKGFTVRSRRSSIKGTSVGQVRKDIPKLGDGFFIVRVPGHVLLLDGNGKTVVDTDPRKRDKRKVTHIFKVFSKKDLTLN